MQRATTCLFLALLTLASAIAQLTLHPSASVVRPAGRWADTVLVSFDPQEPLAIVRRVNSMGEQRATHVIFDKHPSRALEFLLGPGLVPASSDSVLFLKVNRLKLDELGGRSSCTLHAEVIERHSGVARRLYEGSVGVTGDRCGKDEQCHEQNLLNALQEFFHAYEGSQASGSGQDPPMADLTTPFAVDPTNTPVLRAQAPKRGLYRSFMDMRMDQPDSLYAFELRETVSSLGGGHIMKLKHATNAIVEQYWGLSDGTNAYVRMGDTFLRLDRSGNAFSTRVARPDTYDAGAAVMGGLFFGLIGGAVAASATASSNAPILCDLDMLCGDLVPRDASAHTETYARNIFQLTRFAKESGTITVECEGLPQVGLTKGQWTSFALPPQASDRTVRIAGASSVTTVGIETNSDDVNVYLIDVKKDGTVTVHKLNEQMRKVVIDDLKAADRRP